MNIEYCPSYGQYVITMRLSHLLDGADTTTTGEIIMTKSLEQPHDARIISITAAVSALKRAESDLLSASMHPSGRRLVGIHVDQFQHLQVLLARTAGKQGELASSLEEAAQEEATLSNQEFERIRGVAKRVAQGRAAAEDVLHAVSASPSPRIALAALQWDPLESTCRHASLSIL